LCCDEEFLARVQRYGRVQVPVLIRWKHRLEAGEVLSVYIYFTRKVGREGFYVRMSGVVGLLFLRLLLKSLE
jgi:bifunctional DNA-binding transcriptional regulator/antitoxin component of YhaV-PrlF toxin-antitoxin module